MAGTGELILRLTLGIVFLLRGWQKLKGTAGFGAFLRRLGGPAPSFYAWTVALVETVGGALMILGMEARLVAFVLAVDMLVTVAVVKLRIGKSLFTSMQQSHGWPFGFVLFGVALAVIFIGPGRWSIDAALGL